eukprot:6200276-Pleurochrysis_carterae.AAC.2
MGMNSGLAHHVTGQSRAVAMSCCAWQKQRGNRLLSRKRLTMPWTSGPTASSDGQTKPKTNTSSLTGRESDDSCSVIHKSSTLENVSAREDDHTSVQSYTYISDGGRLQQALTMNEARNDDDPPDGAACEMLLREVSEHQSSRR